MAQVVAFDAIAPRIARQPRTANRANGETVFGKIIVFTGVWHERVDPPEQPDGTQAAGGPKTS